MRGKDGAGAAGAAGATVVDGATVVGAAVVDGAVGAVVVVDPFASFRTRAVGASTTPVTLRPTTLWNVRRTERVRASKFPVAPPRSVNPFRMMASCSAFTAGPDSPNRGIPGAVLAPLDWACTVAADAVPAGARVTASVLPATVAAIPMMMCCELRRMSCSLVDPQKGSAGPGRT